MKLIGRLFIVFGTLALAAWAAWTFFFGRSDVQQQLYQRAMADRYALAQVQKPDASAFRATVCAASPCLIVEAGGLAFLVGAGQGAAEGLELHGLMRADLDAVLLTDLDLAGHEGLAGLAAPLAKLGRREPVTVYGPPGADNIVAGANLTLRGPIPTAPTPPPGAAPPPAPPMPFALAAIPPSTGPESPPVFDSGVVSVRGYPVEASPSERIWRIDFDKRSLVVAACHATAREILDASRGAARAALVVPSTSAWMLDADAQAASKVGLKPPVIGAMPCLNPDEAAAAMTAAKFSGGLLAPLHPVADDVPARRLWRSLAAPRDGLALAAGEPGVVLELKADGPSIIREGKPVVAKAAKPAAFKPANPAPKSGNATPEKQAGP